MKGFYCISFESLSLSLAEEFSPTGNDPNKNFRCEISDTEWEFTKPYTSIITEVVHLLHFIFNSQRATIRDKIS